VQIVYCVVSYPNSRITPDQKGIEKTQNFSERSKGRVTMCQFLAPRSNVRLRAKVALCSGWIRVARWVAACNDVITGLALPDLTFGVGRLLHLPSAEAVSVRPNAQPRCNQKVTVIGCEAETSAVRPKSAVKPNKSPATWDW